MLTNRASIYLQSLERLPFVSTRLVETIFQDRGEVLFPCWLDFHDRFAGHVEHIGRDIAIWGLIHENPRWLVSLQPSLDSDIDENNAENLYVACADVHPSYDYQLDQRGHFTGPCAATFDIHVERVALIRDFCSELVKALLPSDLQDPDVRARILGNAMRVTEASDQYFEYSMSDSHLVLRNRETDVLRGWIRVGV